MKQIAIISGKGGTGKTTLTASLARIIPDKVMVDADVDASNLELLTDAKISSKEKYTEGKFALINNDKCTSCGLCATNCRFNAIYTDKQERYFTDETACEGCGVCNLVCPVDAIEMIKSDSGYIKHSRTPFGSLWHGELSAGKDNSGKLVTIIRENAIKEAMSNSSDWILIDGAPGIGCPVIASLTGVDLVLIITEPTVSGLHDLERVLDLAKHFNVEARVCINKYDINYEMTAEILRFCEARGVDLVGKIPFDPVVTESIVEAMAVVEFKDSEVSDEIKRIWEQIG